MTPNRSRAGLPWALALLGMLAWLPGIRPWAPHAGASPWAPSQVEAVLIASRDNTLYEDQTGILSNGQGSHMFAGRTQTGDLRRAVVGFDMTQASALCPQGSTVTTAVLNLTMNRTVAGTLNVTIHRLLDDWGEGLSNAIDEEGQGAAAEDGDATWQHTFFNVGFWANDGGDFDAVASASASVAGVGGYSWGSTAQTVADVQRWLDNPSENYGWLVRGFEGAAGTTKRFSTRNNPLVVEQPRLAIRCTTDPGSEVTPTATATATGTSTGATATATPSATGPSTGPTATATASATGPSTGPTATATASPTVPTATSTGTAPTPTATHTIVATPSATATGPSTGPTPTPSQTPTGTAATPTVTPSLTPTVGPSATATASLSPTVAPPTPTATATRQFITPTPSATGATATPDGAGTPGDLTATPDATGTPGDPTATVDPAVPTSTDEPTPTTGPAGSETPTPDASPTTTPTDGPSPTRPPASFWAHLPIVLQRADLKPILAIEPEANFILVGDEVVLAIEATGLRQFVSMEIEITYNPDLLEPIDADAAAEGVQAAPGPFPNPSRVITVANQIDIETGRARYAFVLDSYHPESGSGRVVELRFRGRAPGIDEVDFDMAVVGLPIAAPMRVTTRGAQVVVLDPSGPPPPTAGPGEPTSEPGVPTTTPGQGTPGLPTSTPRPSEPTPGGPPPECLPAIANGGFERGLENWVRGGSPLPRTVAGPVHGGAASLLLGITPDVPNSRSAARAWQRLLIPEGTTSLTVSGWALQGAEAPGGSDRQMLVLTRVEPVSSTAIDEPAAIVFREVVSVPAWRRWSLTLDPRNLGDSVWLVGAVVNDGVGGRTWMLLDDVQVTACR